MPGFAPQDVPSWAASCASRPLQPLLRRVFQRLAFTAVELRER